MKRFILLILQVLVCVMIDAQGVRYTSAYLKMHKEASVNSDVVMVLPKGTPVVIEDDCNCLWIPINYKGNIGFVSAKYLVKQKGKIFHHKNYSNSKRYYYTNMYGNRVPRPTYYNRRPAGATALCNDGTYSFSQSRRGTCSHHGGVAHWLR